jgi:cytochrome P450
MSFSTQSRPYVHVAMLYMIVTIIVLSASALPRVSGNVNDIESASASDKSSVVDQLDVSSASSSASSDNTESSSLRHTINIFLSQLISSTVSNASWISIGTGMTIVASLTGAYLLWCVRAKPLSAGTPGACKSYPFFGHFLFAYRNQDRVLEMLLDFTRKFNGKTWGFTMPTQSVYCISSPENVKHVLHDKFETYVKGPIFKDRLEELLGGGIFNVDGAAWKLQRKTASHMFTMRKLNDFMTKVMVEEARVVVKRLEALAPGEYIDMHDVFYRYTVESFAKIAFGLNLQVLETGDPEIDAAHRSQGLAGSDITGEAFLQAFDEAQELMEHRFYYPWWKLNRALNIGQERRIKKHIKVLNDFAFHVIRQRREMEEHDLIERGDFLSLFLGIKDEAGKPFSDKYLRDVLMNLIIAGRDTTAQALSWATYSLAEHPHEYKKMCTEVDSFVTESKEHHPDWSKTRDLPYVRAVIRETLRLYPSVPKDIKFATRDDVLPDGHLIPAGAQVCYMPWVTGRLESMWHRAGEFRPQRWVDKEDPVMHQPKLLPYKFTAFNAGRRECLGKPLAMHEATILLGMLARNFTFHLKPGHPVEYRRSLTLPMKYGLQVRVEKRNCGSAAV